MDCTILLSAFWDSVKVHAPSALYGFLIAFTVNLIFPQPVRILTKWFIAGGNWIAVKFKSIFCSHKK